jgi:hypothetical protein
MKKLDSQQIYEYVEKYISIFHKKRLDIMYKIGLICLKF